MKLEFRQRLLATTLLVGAGMVAAPAFAQGQAPATPPTCPPGVTPGTNGCNAPEPAQTIAPASAVPPAGENAQGAPITQPQEIIVTGTRIPQPNLQTASPVTTVSSQDVKVTGTTRTEDLINSLPQVFASQGSDISNGASGTASVDLRGLGPKRNLVLINGRRLQPGDTGSSEADINFIPSQLIKRVDVLTGGASSVYGADAVAGVVNFVLDTTFTGFRIDGEASVFQHNNNAPGDVLSANAAKGFLPPHGNVVNGGAQDIAGMFGASFDDGRGHVMAYATYRSQDPILESTRDYSFCALGAKTAGGYKCGGSGTSANGTFLQYDPNDNFNFLGEYQVAGNKFIPGSTPFNYATYNYFQRPDERYNLGAFADYEIAPGAHPYMEAMFMDDHTDAQIAPSGDFGNTNRIACDNAFLSPQQVQTLCSAGTFTDSLNGMQNVQQSFTYILRRNVEGGGRDDDVRHTDWRVVAGLRGDPLPGLSYDLYYQTGQTLRNEIYNNDFSVRRLGMAIDAVAVDANGNIVTPGTAGSTIECRAVLTGLDPNCVPYDIFQTGAVNPAALTYLETPGLQKGSVVENIAHLDVTLTGDQYGLKSPWSDTGIGLNVGTEYRKESLDFKVDQEFSTGDLAGQGGATPPVSGHFDVREAFAELQIPIIEHSFIYELALDGGYRYSNYHIGNHSFNTNTYKLEGRFAPVRDILFRASYNRAVRAPNIVELFFPTNEALSGTVDPCANQIATGVPSATLAQCELTGVTAAQYGNISSNPASQYNGLFGGNPNLQPEKADTWTAGVILQPRFVPGLALSGDYFNIKVNNLIGTVGFAAVMNNCLAGQTNYCALIHRAPGTGSLWLGTQGYIQLTNINIAGVGLQTKGFDFQGSYTHRLGGLGNLNISYVGTYLTNLSSPAVDDTNCAGLYASECGIPNPKYRHTLRFTLTMPQGLGISAAWRHFSGVKATPSSDISLPNPDAQLDAANFFDLALTARLAQRLNLRMGVNNILDAAPPIISANIGSAGSFNGNTTPQMYDSMGRFVFAGFTVDF